MDRNEMLKMFPKGMRIAEIGVFRGEFSEVLLNVCEPSELHLVDIWQGSYESGDKDGKNIVKMDMSVALKEVQDKFATRPEVVIHHAPSNILTQFPDNYFDMIYVDGDHTYAGVWFDLLMAKYKSRAFICGHDYVRDAKRKSYHGIVKAVDEFCSYHKMSVLTLTDDRNPSFIICHNCGYQTQDGKLAVAGSECS